MSYLLSFFVCSGTSLGKDFTSITGKLEIMNAGFGRVNSKTLPSIVLNRAHFPVMGERTLDSMAAMLLPVQAFNVPQ